MSGNLIIISGPSGAGKSSVVRELIGGGRFPLKKSVSATTRQAREGEVNGVDYLFLTHQEFASRRAAGEFLECKEVFGRGDWYGTLAEGVEAGLREGKWMVLEIDVEGAAAVLEQRPDALTIFIDPGSREELERRLRGRQTESDEAIRRRLEVADRELAQAHRYQYRVVNTTVPEAVGKIYEILAGHTSPAASAIRT
jgi:guanylate kinase